MEKIGGLNKESKIARQIGKTNTIELIIWRPCESEILESKMRPKQL